MSIEIGVVSQVPTFNRIDGSAFIYDGQQLIGMATSVDISVLGSGGVVQTYSGTAVFNSNPNCNGTGPATGSTSASWSGMSLIPSSAAASCTIAADVKLPDDIPAGLYTLVFSDLTGFFQPIETRIEGGVVTVTTTGGTTAFNTAIASVDITVVADTTGPDGSITAPAGPVAPGEVFGASVVFNEPVTGFDSSDLTVANGTVSNFVANTDESGLATSFSFDVTAGATGPVTIDVAAGVAQDAAGNDNVALTQASTTIAGELSISAAFLGDPPAPGGSTTLRFTIQNSDDTETGTIASFSSDLDAELAGLVAALPATTNTCASTVSGTDTVSVSGGTVAPSSSCLIDVPVTVPGGAAPGTYRVGTSIIIFSYPVAGAGFSEAAATQLTVAGAEGGGAPLAFSKSFTNDPVLPGATVTLEYSIVPEEGTSASALAFTDDLDSVLSGLAATGLPQTDVCGTGSTLSGTDTISLTGGNLADGETCTFSVTVQTPVGSSGDFVSSTSELSGTQNDGGGDVAIDTGFIASDTLTLINQIPQVTISGPAGPVAAGEGFTATIEFSEPVTGFLIGEIDLTNAAASDLQTSDNETFTVTITPAAAGNVVVGVPAGVAQDADTNDNAAATNFNVTAQVAAPEIAVQFVGAAIEVSDGETTPSTAALTDFGTVDVATGMLQRTVRISNTGVGVLTIGSITSTDTTNYTLGTAPTTVAGGGSQSFTITYDPTTAAAHGSTITINSDDADEAAFDFAITGTGGSAPEINVQGNAVNIADGDVTASAADHTEFDPVAAGATGDRVFAIQNLGGADLTLGTNAVSIINDPDGVFSVTAQPAAVISTGGSDTAVTVQAAPTTPGTFSAQVSIASNDADENPYTFAIEITATGAPEVDLQGSGISILSGDTTPATADDTDFESVIVGASSTATFTILNTGNSDLVLTAPSGARGDVVERQSGSTDFTITAQPGSSIAAGGSETFTVQYAPSAAGAASAVFGFATNDADEALYTFTVGGTGNLGSLSVADVTVNEGAGTATFTVTLSQNAGADVTVDYATSDGTAAAGSDYTAASGTVTISTGTASNTFTVPITDDSLDEADETFTVTLSNPIAGATISDDTATGTITDNDATPSLDTSTFALIDESGGELTLVADLSGPTFQDVIVGYATDTAPGPGAPGVATADDVVAEASTFTIPAGSTRGSFTITIIDDAIDEGLSEFGNVFVTSITNATGTIGGNWEFEITDNDAPPTVSIADVTVSEGDGTASFTVSLSGQISTSATVDFATADGTALAGSDYTATTGTVTFSPLDTAETITVSITDDALDEVSENFTVNLSNANAAPFGALTLSDASATGTITDNDDAPALSIADVTVNEGDGTATFTVSLDAASGQTVTVDFATADGTAAAGSDYTANTGTLTFTPGDTTETVTIAITDDAIDEPDETFTVGLTNPGNATIADASATGTITDNDAAPTLSIADLTVGEGDGTATFTVSLSGPSGQTITVDYATADATAVDGSDYTNTSGRLTFTPGDTTETFTVTILDDALDEANEVFGAGLVSPTNATISDATAEATITDNDGPPSLSIADVTVDEGDGTATFTVSLNTPSGQTVSVGYETADGTALVGSDYASASGTLNFVPGDTSETLTVTITDDALDETDETFFVGLASASNATISDASATGTITDNDAAPALSIADVTVSEDAGTASFTVTQSAVSALTVMVDFTTTDGTATAGSDFTANAGTLTINPGETTETVTVAITDDGVVEPDETFTVDLSNPANATLADASATGTITNDDAAPAGYTASFDADPINAAGASSAAFTFASAVVGTTYSFTISSDGGGMDVTGSGSVTSASQQVTGIDVSGLGDGTLTLSATLTDAFGNEGAATGDTTTKETTLPSVAITTASPDPVSGVFTVTVTFSEDVTGFAVGDIMVGNGSAGAFASTSASVYTADITPAADGQVSVDIAANAAQDAAGNGNTAAAQFTIESDSTPPGVTISTASSEPVSGPFTATFTFTEAVTGFAQADINVGNGSASGFVAVSASVYTAVITPTADGTVTIDVAAGAAQDSASNANTAATQFSIETDGTAPTVVSLVFSDTDVRLNDVGSQQTATVTFSEALDPTIAPVLTAMADVNLETTFALLSGEFSAGNTVYTATYSVSDGGVSAPNVDVVVNGATDTAGNVMAQFTAEDAFSVEMRRGGITVVQTVVGSVDGAFDFSGGLGDFIIATSGQTGSQAFTDLAEGEYAITLAEEDGFSVTGLVCDGGTTTVDLATRTATVTLAPTDAVECRFEATADAVIDETTIPVTIPLVLPSLIDDPTSVSVTFPLTNNGGVAFDFSITVDQPWLAIDPSAGTIPAGGTLNFTVSLTDAILDLPPGIYTANVTITQTIPAGSTSVGGSSTQNAQTISIPVTVELAPREGTLTLVATTAPSIAGEGVFRYSSDIAGLDGLSLTTVGGTASSDGLTVLRGSYQITQAVSEGWRLDSISCTGDTDSGSTFDVANGVATIDLDPEEVMVCTFANRRDEDFIREVTQSAIRSFMAARADQILNASPDVARRLRSDRTGATPNSFAVDMTENRMNASFSTSLSAIRQAASERENRMPDQPLYSLAGTTGMSSLDVWFEASYSSVTDDRAGLDADTEFGMYAVGVDIMAREDILVGALVQFDQAETVTGRFRSQVEGDGWLAGPYMAARLGETLVFDARVAWGQSDNQVNPIGTYWDDFETHRWLAEANLVGDITQGPWRISPEVGFAYFFEEQDQYTDSLGFVIPSQEITLGRITAGPEIAYRFETDAGGVFEPFVKLTAVYDYDDTEVINVNGLVAGLGTFRADARIGLAAEFANGGRLSAEAAVSGLGEGDFEANTGMIRIRLPLSLD